MGFYTYIGKSVRAFTLTALLFGPAQAENLLIMFDSEGCPYCDLWKRQIGPIYPKTEESRIAPLLMIDINAPLPEGVSILSDPIYTPTFVLVHDGKEIARLAGYPGEDFFWGLLDRMIEKIPNQTTEGSL